MIAPGQSTSASATDWRLPGSRLFVGSSSSSRLLRPTISIASASFVFSPPDSVPASWNTFSPVSPNMPSRPRSWVSVSSDAERHLAADVVEQRLVACAGCRAPGRSSRSSTLWPHVTRAAVGVGLAGEDAQQARLAGAVEPEHEQPLAPAEVEGDVVEDRRAGVGLGQPGDLDDGAPGRRRRRELHPQHACRRGARRPCRPPAGRSASPCCGPARPWWPWRRSGRRTAAAGRSPWPGGPPSWSGAPRRRPATPGTACTCPCTRRGGRWPASSGRSRWSTRVIASSSRSRSWLMTSSAPR